MAEWTVGEETNTQDLLSMPTKPLADAPHEAFSIRPVLFFSAAVLIYLAFYLPSVDHKYVDFGDGNYLYISWRLTEGETLYYEIPCPQPPLLLFWGSFLLHLQSGDPVLIRLWQGIQHVLIAACVWGIAFRLFQRRSISALAGIIYLFLPEGVWWAAGYQSEPLLILLQGLNLLLFLSAIQKPKPSLALYGSALTAVLGCFTNMTALPYVVLQWFFVGLRYRKLFWHYTLTISILGIAFLTGMMLYSHGVYLDHVFFRQVGTYPHQSWTETILYFWNKLSGEGGDILFFEGGLVFAALWGMILFSGDERKVAGKEYLFWWGIFSLGSIIFVTKGGTVEYIFTLGEPATAVFSAYFFTMLFTAGEIPWRPQEIISSPLQFGKYTLILCLLLPALLMKPATLLYQTFTNSNQTFELSSAEMEKTAQFIQYQCPPHQTVLAPPYYAFLAKRKIPANASELFVLSLAYFNEWGDMKKRYQPALDLPDLESKEMNQYLQANRDYGQIYRYIRDKEMPELKRLMRFSDWQNPYMYWQTPLYSTQSVLDLAALFDQNPLYRRQFPAIALFLDIRKQIMEKKVALILVNTHHTFFSVPPIHQAIRDYCTPVERQMDLPNREERILFYRCKS